MWHAIFHTKPIAKGRPRFSSNGHAYTPAKTRDAGNELKFMIMQKKPVLLFDQALHVEIVFTFLPPKTKPKNRIYPTVKPDCSNLVKCIEDSCNGLVWTDDCLITDLIIKKRYGEKESIEIFVIPIGGKVNGS